MECWKATILSPDHFTSCAQAKLLDAQLERDRRAELRSDEVVRCVAPALAEAVRTGPWTIPPSRFWLTLAWLFGALTCVF